MKNLRKKIFKFLTGTDIETIVKDVNKKYEVQTPDEFKKLLIIT